MRMARPSLRTFLSTPSARRATRYSLPVQVDRSISIHALREEGDAKICMRFSLPTNFYPRPPRGGRPELPANEFLDQRNFYPRPPRGGRRREPTPRTEAMQFLSTPSARRATRDCRNTRKVLYHFYPRPPRGGRLWYMIAQQWAIIISIHALREEGDDVYAGGQCDHPNFYPRPPRGGRHFSRLWLFGTRQFLSTPSARRATRFVDTAVGTSLLFLSTPSARRATCPVILSNQVQPISIHALREEGDLGHTAAHIVGGEISIHALREEGDP